MVSKDASVNDFGLLIAYVLPGFTAIWGLSFLSPSLRQWLGSSQAEAATLAGFLYATVASIIAGMTVSTIRWLLLDALHHRTGIRPPAWDFYQLRDSAAAFDTLVNIHYKYYQFNANMLVSLAVAFLARRVSMGFWSAPLGWLDLACLALAVVFYLGSRDTLAKYYARTGQLLQARRRVPAR